MSPTMKEKKVMQFLIVILTLAMLFVIHYSNTKEQPPQQVVYPVFIGSNGYCIRDEIVNGMFNSLGKYFDTWFYNGTYNQTVYTVSYFTRWIA